jgi:hypothetical protein
LREREERRERRERREETEELFLATGPSLDFPHFSNPERTHTHNEPPLSHISIPLIHRERALFLPPRITKSQKAPLPFERVPPFLERDRGTTPLPSWGSLRVRRRP